MTAFTRRRLGAASAAGALGLLATACSSSGTTDAAQGEDAGSSDAGGEAGTVEVQDNNGSHTITTPIGSVVATDNRTFETLYDWGVPLTAAAVALMPSTIGYVDDASIIDLGNHNEPDLEAVVAAEPDLIINGQRFTQYQEDFQELAPEAVILNLDPREEEPLDAELIRQVTVLGEVFSKEEEAAALVADFEASIQRVKDAYDPAQTVMAVITSGGEIGYSAPGNGRTFGPMYDILGLTPSLEVPESSEDHQGDDISVEAIAESSPDWMLVMDRDAAIMADDPEYVQASDVLENSEALAGVTAITEGNLVYMPADTYTNESIQTHTEFFTALADALEGKS